MPFLCVHQQNSRDENALSHELNGGGGWKRRFLAIYGISSHGALYGLRRQNYVSLLSTMASSR